MLGLLGIRINPIVGAVLGLAALIAGVATGRSAVILIGVVLLAVSAIRGFGRLAAGRGAGRSRRPGDGGAAAGGGDRW